MDGTWRRGGVSGDHFGIIVIAIREAGDDISGTACRTSSGHLIFRDVPVTGRNPYVTFTLDGGRYEGEIVSEELIDGLFQYAGGSQEWAFQRTALSEFEACQSALP
ncbi:MAG TPA: hypothetical protein VGL15_04250 [Vicinamibacteria bacterium]|jgi:hypothetical protein